MYQQFDSSHSSPSYRAITASSSAAADVSGTVVSCTMLTPAPLSQPCTAGSCPVPDGQTVTTQADGERAANAIAAAALVGTSIPDYRMVNADSNSRQKWHEHSIPEGERSIYITKGRGRRTREKWKRAEMITQGERLTTTQPQKDPKAHAYACAPCTQCAVRDTTGSSLTGPT